jgi:hypothetical protein
MSRNALDLRLSLPSDRDLAKMFDAVPKLQRHGVAKKATTAAAKVIVAKARAIAPRGTEKDRKKRSNSQKASANWNIRLHTTIAYVTRVAARLAYSVVGPRHPDGNKAYLNSPKSGSRQHVLWGRRKGRVRRATRNWIVQAFDETQNQQLAEMKASLMKSTHDMMMDN